MADNPVNYDSRLTPRDYTGFYLESPGNNEGYLQSSQRRIFFAEIRGKLIREREDERRSENGAKLLCPDRNLTGLNRD